MVPGRTIRMGDEPGRRVEPRAFDAEPPDGSEPLLSDMDALGALP